MIGETIDQHPQKGRQLLSPLVFQAPLFDTADVYLVETADYRVETSGIDYEVEFELPIGGQDAVPGDSQNGSLIDVY